MDLHKIFRQFLQKHPNVCQQKWLIAVSGGMDSVVLATICKEEKIEFSIAHCNFNLRGAESLRDKAFVEQMATELNVPFFVNEFDTNAYIQASGKSVQVAARELRYSWFAELANEQNIKYIATAHHASDNAETVLMNLFRGTGLKGIRGMLPVQGSIIRPLLNASREMIETYAKQHQLQWVEDSSNETDKYTRNYLRHHLFPLVQQAIPHSHTGFEHSIHLLSETEILYKEAIQLHRKKLVEIVGAELHIPVLKLAKLPAAKTILYEILTEYGFTAMQLNDAFGLLNAESGKFVASPTHRIIRNRAWLIIAPQKTTDATHVLIEKKKEEIFFQEGALQIKQLQTLPAEINDDALVALLDASEIHFPLLLRPWQKGDYFYPLGMQKKKKLSKFLIDKKLSTTDKEKIWVVESQKKILWIIGQRIDNRFKLQPNTSRVLQLTFIKNVDALAAQ